MRTLYYQSTFVTAAKKTYPSSKFSSRGVDLPDVRFTIAADYIFIGGLYGSAAVLVFRRTH